MKIPFRRANKERRTILVRLQEVRNNLAKEEIKLADVKAKNERISKELERSISETNKALADISLKVASLIKRKDGLEVEIKDSKTILVDVTEKIGDIEDDIAIATDAKEKIENEIKDLETESVGISNDISSKNIMLSGIQAQVDAVLKDISGLERKKEDISTDIKSLENEKAEAQHKLDVIKKEEGRLRAWEMSLSKREELVKQQYAILGISYRSKYGN